MDQQPVNSSRNMFRILTTAAISLAMTAAVLALGRLAVSYMLDRPLLRSAPAWVINQLGSAVMFTVTGLLVFTVLFILLGNRLVFKPREKTLSLRWKLLLMLLGSLTMTAAGLFIIYLVATALFPVKIINLPLIWAINTVGSTPVLIVLGTALFLASFLLLSDGLIRNLERVESGLKEAAEGHLDYRVAVDTSDEISHLATELNRMSEKISWQLGEITRGLQEMEQSNFSYEIPVSSGDFGSIAASINKMARQIDRLIQDERRAEQTKNDLITGVSHDLRTPLTSILGFLELIENDRYKDELELRYYVNIAYDKATALQKLIDDLFEFTRINNGLPLHKNGLDMDGLLRQLAEEFVPSLEKSGMEIRIESQEQAIILEADGDLLVRSYENLISNAIQYGAGGRYVDIRLLSRNAEAVIQIINYGPPIPEKDIPYVFDRFYRVDQSRSRQTGGTGLGLAIAKSIVEAHGGKIQVYSSREFTMFETCYPLQNGSRI